MKKRPFLAAAQYRAKQGSIVWKGIRYLIVRPETIVGFQKAVEGAIGRRAGDLLARGGFEGGRRSAQRLIQLGKLDARRTLEAMSAMGGEIGWGKFTVERFSAERRQFIVTVRHSPFAGAYGKAKTPSCHLIRGVLAGVAGVIFGKGVTVRENLCASVAGGHCQFVAQQGGSRK